MLQSEQFGDRYLRLLREAIMLNGNNISRQDVLVEVAVNLKQEFESFNLEVFKEDLHNDKALEAFRIDLQQVRNYDINRLPTLIIRRPQQPSKIIKGYRPYNVLLDVLEKISPGISKIRQAETAEQYAEYWKGILPRELEEAVGSHK